MMGQAASLFDCGITELLVGEPDWVIGTDGVRHSDSRIARDRQRTMDEVRTKIVQREQLIQRVEMEINTCQREALACRTRLQQGGLSANDQRLLMARAKRALQSIAAKQAVVRREQTIVAMARNTLDKIEHVNRGDDTRELFTQLNGLTQGLQLDEGRTDDLADAGNDVLESHAALADYDREMDNTVQLFDTSLANADTNSEFDLNDPSGLMGALDQLSSAEPLVAEQDATAWAGATAARAPPETRAGPISSMPAAPSHTPNSNRGPTAGGAPPQLAHRRATHTTDQRLEDVFL